MDFQHIHTRSQEKTITKKQKQKTSQLHKQTNKKWITFTNHSPLIRKVTIIFKQTNLKIAFRATNTIHQQLTKKPVQKIPAGYTN